MLCWLDSILAMSTKKAAETNPANKMSIDSYTKENIIDKINTPTAQTKLKITTNHLSYRLKN